LSKHGSEMETNNLNEKRIEQNNMNVIEKRIENMN